MAENPIDTEDKPEGLSPEAGTALQVAQNLYHSQGKNTSPSPSLELTTSTVSAKAPEILCFEKFAIEWEKL